MISIFKSRINVQTDTLHTALGKKNSNQSLSGKTLSKLVSIVNSQYEFKNNEANFIQGEKLSSNKINREGMARLISHLQESKGLKTETFLAGQIDKWVDRAQNLLDKNEAVKDMGQPVGKGTRGAVYKKGDLAVKVIKNFNKDDALHEVKMLNSYAEKISDGGPRATLVDKTLEMPFLNGGKTSYSETCAGVEDMFQKGFYMGDAKPSNFLKTAQGAIIPVDFGLVFTRDELASIPDGVKKAIVSDFVKGGFRYIPVKIKSEYISRIKELDASLGKESPTRKMNVKNLAKAGFSHP